MRVLITGAGGNLGRSLVPALAQAGHQPRLMDNRPLETNHEFVLGDVRNPDDVQRAVAGVEAIVHAAALHGIHLRGWTPQDFWTVNVMGTFNVYEAARLAGLERVVLSSTIGVYGASAQPAEAAWTMVTEALPCRPTDVYGLSKQVCEDMAQTYGRRWGITTVALRLGMFVPETWERYGLRLLFGGVDDRDAAQAALLALSHAPAGRFDFFNITADVPFSTQDLAPLQTDPAAVLEHYWPGAAASLAGLDLAELLWSRLVWPPDKAKRGLGYQPQYNFGEFLRAFQAGNPAHYPFAGLPWWGV